jgi:hypothetical protein
VCLILACITQCPDVVNVQPKGRWSALHWAAAEGNEEIVTFLLASRADVNAKASDGRTPRDVAASSALKHRLAPCLASGSAPEVRWLLMEALAVFLNMRFHFLLFDFSVIVRSSSVPWFTFRTFCVHFAFAFRSLFVHISFIFRSLFVHSFHFRTYVDQILITHVKFNKLHV